MILLMNWTVLIQILKKIIQRLELNENLQYQSHQIVHLFQIKIIIVKKIWTRMFAKNV